MEFQNLLKDAASVVNDRPLAYRRHGGAEGEFQPITANMLLHTSRTRSPIHSLEDFDDAPERFVRRLKFRQRCLREWWEEWYKHSFDSMIVRTKWRTSSRNLRVGDLVLIKDHGKFTPGEYRRGKVVEVIVEDDGHVRTVFVQYYKHDARRQVDRYVGEGMAKVRYAVQRLVVLLTVEEMEEDASCNLEEV